MTNVDAESAQLQKRYCRVIEYQLQV